MEEKNTDISPRDKHIIACVWDFDKTLSDGYMQEPIFAEYGIDERKFWDEVNALPALYAKKGVRVAPETVYLNHILSYVKNGILNGLTNAKLRELGGRIEFCAGLPDFFDELKLVPQSADEFRRLDIKLEHYIVSTGLAEMIRGSKIAKHVDGIFGCEFIEEPYPPNYLRQKEFNLEIPSANISQIGMMVDNTIKTRFIFEINKGSNKSARINVNASMQPKDRRVPIRNMIYVADGPSDVPVFSVVRKGGGKTFAVYTPGSTAGFAQNDELLSSGRIDAYGPADYRRGSATHTWLGMHVKKICARIVAEHDAALSKSVGRTPEHLREEIGIKPDPENRQQKLL